MKVRFIAIALLATLTIFPSNAIVYEELPDDCRQWVDSVMQTMDLHARIGQLFMPAAMSTPDNGWPEKIKMWVEQCKIGGIYFSGGDLNNQAVATNRLQQIASSTRQVPLMVGADAEWGLAMRIPGTIQFPHNTMLGAVTDTSLLFAYGQEMANQCRSMGMQVDFGPVADVNNNPQNPVIGDRSFGADPKQVAWRAAAFASGLASGGVLPVAKHFPGHGNTAEDSHEQLAKVTNSREGLNTTELYPFRYLISNGLEGIMAGHLSVPALDTVTHLPSSQSPVIINGVLREELGFDGLCITDALAMKGAAASFSGVNCIRSLQAGNDILLKPVNLVSDIKAVEEAVSQGLLTEELINEKCRRVLAYKYVLGLVNYPHIDVENLQADLHTPEAEALNRQLHEAAMTLLRNEKDFLPLRHLDTQRTAIVLLGQNAPEWKYSENGAPYTDSQFAARVLQYQENSDIIYLTEGCQLDQGDLAHVLNTYDRVIVGVYANTAVQRKWIERMRPLAPKLCIVFFSSPYSIARHGAILKEASAVLCAYEKTELAQQVAAEAVFGGIDIKGVLPAPIGSYYRLGDGLTTEKSRIGYGWPEQEGMSSEVLSTTDTIIAEAIAAGAFPGAQLLVARNGRIVLSKAYGHIDADKSRKTETTDLYDLASLTKVMVTTPAIMTLCEEGKIRLDEPVSNHLPALRESDKAKLTYRQILYHESRLAAGINFYLNLIDTASYSAERLLSSRCDDEHPDFFDTKTWVAHNFSYYTDLMSPEPRDSFKLKVAEGMYVHTSFRDTVVKLICDSNLRKYARYCYSDIGFMLLGFAAETLTDQTLDVWAESSLFASLGAYNTLYHPLNRFSKERIVPTALDTTLRHQLLRGYPHDEAAAFIGGVSGNAGLFSSAQDMVKYLQMLLWNGTYGGHRYFEPSTVRFFTSKRSRLSRRMLGFDAAEPNTSYSQTTSELAPKCTYGHTGFTGTCFWTDPQNGLIFILLANRIQPDRTNRTMFSMDVRTRLQDVLYESIVR